MGRVNETQAHGDAPQVPISPHPRSRRVVTRHQSQIRAHSLRCLVTLEAENGRWGRGRDTRSAVKRRGTPFSASVMNWKCYYLVEFSELALPAEEASSAGRALSPAPSALSPACELDWIWWDLLSTDFLWLDLTNPLFFIFVNLSKNQCSQSSVWQHNLTSPFFFYHCFVYFLKQMFSAFPYFLSFLSVFIGLMFSDIIWPPPFFIILYPIITRSKFSDIFWPFPYFSISFF